MDRDIIAMEGRVDKKLIQTSILLISPMVKWKRDEQQAQLGFCNNNTTIDTWYGPELPVAGDYAKWMIEPIDDDETTSA